nr:MAG TPA: hypothetical protein [Crassvirales sp.]
MKPYYLYYMLHITLDYHRTIIQFLLLLYSLPDI